jgi:NADH:ubiquinone reductase (H+-translocating)
MHIASRKFSPQQPNVLGCLVVRPQFHCRLSPFQLRLLSTKASPEHRGRAVRFLYRFFAYTGLFILTSTGLVFAFFVYDATTYKDNATVCDIPVCEQALSPQRGGPKNLPIASVLVDDEDSPEMSAQRDKPKMVILGTGWGSIALLKTLHAGDYHVTVVSPVNHFLFTPMLPSATVGTLEFRSLVEPVRRIVQRIRGHFLQAEAESVDFSEKLVEVSQVDSSGKKVHFYLPYDKLVIGVGTYYLHFLVSALAC